MEGRLIVTRSDDGIKEITDITHPFIKNYADKCEAEFIILDDPKGLHPHWRILQLYELFEKYDRILVLDSDILILKNCPNLFVLVSRDMIGSIYEDVGTRLDKRREMIYDIQQQRGSVDWESGYINTGCFICSKEHKEIFNVDKDKLWPHNLGADDVELGYHIHRLGYEIWELPFRFNHMTMFSEEFNNFASRFNSYIIHYAGPGVFLHTCKNRLENIKQDSLILTKYSLI